MAKTSKQTASEWWYVDGKKLDGMGIMRWFPLFNGDEKGVKRDLRLCERSPMEQRIRSGVGPEFVAFRISAPDFDRATETKKILKSAKKGTCPACSADPKHARKGKSRGYSAFKCGKCDHTWRIEGTRDPAYVPPAPPEAVGASKATKGAKSISEAAKKAKKDRKKNKKAKAKKGKK